MAAAADCTVTPFFLESQPGPVFAVYYAPPDRKSAQGGLVFVPPFAEEMNRARRTVALQARILAREGIGVLVLDLFGTGDSAGDFSDARYDIWVRNILEGADWLRSRGFSQVGLWGLRAGALLVSAVAANRSDRFRRLMLWQPISDGKLLLSQFLRLGATGARLSGDLGASTEHLRSELAAGRSVEVAGYELSSELASALSRLQIVQFDPGPDVRIHWIEVVAKPDNPLPPVAERIVGAWRSKGVAVTAEAIPGEPFWAIEEATPPPALLEATARTLEACPW